ncbi:hypothetical protein [Ruegeria faecimaris]|uniref:Uncharacterized protein n=1 Tax=Ruegeria faecimaris TaxID=686389 RepID=A0A521C607_9RHOB|nr:hypothetical protein [Ruegeria faecimaris]SMO54947.1 hypothetical protein SAMN06265380_102176 [Ruegeria faecimaris]
MRTKTNSADAAEALELLEQAWAYYTPETVIPTSERMPELFEYANAA